MKSFIRAKYLFLLNSNDHLDILKLLWIFPSIFALEQKSLLGSTWEISICYNKDIQRIGHLKEKYATTTTKSTELASMVFLENAAFMKSYGRILIENSDHTPFQELFYWTLLFNDGVEGNQSSPRGLKTVNTFLGSSTVCVLIYNKFLIFSVDNIMLKMFGPNLASDHIFVFSFFPSDSSNNPASVEFSNCI